MDKMNIRKAAMIGCGFVGASSAFALMQSGIFSEMVMIDADHAKAEGEAMDLSHGLPSDPQKCGDIQTDHPGDRKARL